MSSRRSKFFASINAKYVLADYPKWQEGRWVHYTNFPTLKINPKTWHNDPAALYFFPEGFKTAGSWHHKKHKFVTKMPSSLRVLDLSQYNTKEAALGLLEKLGVKPEGDKWEQFGKRMEHPIDAVWDYLKQVFTSQSGLFNKTLRQAGFDAVFDDTDAIFSGETQILILDPTKIKVTEIKDEGAAQGTGYKEVAEILSFIADEGKQYGFAHIAKPKKTWSGYDQANQLSGTVQVSTVDSTEWDPEAHYINWRVVAFRQNFGSTNNKHMDHDGKDSKRIDRRNDHTWQRKKYKENEHSSAPFNKLRVEVRSSNPDMEKDYSVKTYYEEDLRDVKIEDIHNMVKKVLKIFFDKIKKAV